MIDTIVSYIIPATYSLLPPKMNSDEATAMLIAIGLQESRFEHRKQIGGPARGFWQFEKGGGTLGVMTHKDSTKHCSSLLRSLKCANMSLEDIHKALSHNDILACGFARLLLWTHPKRLPSYKETDRAWDYYLSTWRPGKPHRDTWDDFYEEAWLMINE